MGQEQSKHSLPQPVIKLHDNTIRCETEAFRRMLADNGLETEDAYVIAITGAYRTGKSFLLNLLYTCIEYYSKHKDLKGWGEGEHVLIKGNRWAQGKKLVTEGIWMYIYPEVVNKKVIMLLDCQGTKDVRHSSATLDNIILYLGLQLSDMHILNVHGTLDSEVLDRLSLCVYHAEEDDNHKLFGRNTFLLRDWSCKEEPDQLDDVLKEATSREVQNAVHGIKKAFKSVNTVALPHPGVAVVAKSEEDDVAVQDLSKEFVSAAKKFFYQLLLDTCESRYTAKQVLEQIEFISKKAYKRIRSPKEAYEESVLKSVVAYFKSQLEGRLGKLIKNCEAMPYEQILQKGEAIRKEISDEFDHHKQVRKCTDQEMIREYKEMLEKDGDSMMRGLKEFKKQLESDSEEKTEPEDKWKMFLRIFAETGQLLLPIVERAANIALAGEPTQVLMSYNLRGPRPLAVGAGADWSLILDSDSDD